MPPRAPAHPERSTPRALFRALAVIACAFVAASTAIVASRSPEADAALPPLSWAPPAGWEQYTPVTIPPSGGVIRLPSSTTDYRIVAPDVVTGPVVLRGGRNVVWIGGHVRIDRDDTARGRYPLATQRRAVLVDDAADSRDGRTVFLEGLRLDGDDLSEGVDIKAPSAHVYLQNIGIDTVRLRGYDDRDATGPYVNDVSVKNHPDLVQPFGGAKSLNIDGLSGRSQYQGMFLADTVNDTSFDLRMRRVDMTAVELGDADDPQFRHAGHIGLGWYGDTNGQIFVDIGTVWFRHHTNSGWAGNPSFRRVAYRDASGAVTRQPVLGTSSFEHNFRAGATYPVAASSGAYAPVLGQDGTGTYVTWPDTAVLATGEPAFRDWSGAAAGRIYSGAPPAGSYVPLETVGVGYRSPGYAGSSPVSPVAAPTTAAPATTAAPTPPTAPTAAPASPAPVTAELCAPDDLDADGEPGAVRLEWDPVERGGPVAGYEVRYRLEGSATWTSTDAGAVTTFVVRGLTARAHYEFEVRARDHAGAVSAWSDTERERAR